MRIVAVTWAKPKEEDNISNTHKCIRLNLFVKQKEPITIEQLEELTIFLESYKSELCQHNKN